MKDFLNKMLLAKNAEMEKLSAKMKASESADEVREIGETLIALRDEINEIEKQLGELNKQEEKPVEEDNKEDNEEDTKEEGVDSRSFNVLSTYGVNKMEERKELKGRDSMEYRVAFKDYVQKGIISPILEKRADGPSTTGDLGVLVPNTVMNEIITKLGNQYGQIYNRVRHLNVKGGVDFAVGEFDFTAKRILEGAAAPTAGKGTISSKVSFGFRHCWIGASRSILEGELDINAFEQKVVEGIYTAYAKKMDNEILVGGGSDSNEMEGILTEADKSSSRIAAANVITFTATEIADWKKWQSKLFSKIPLEMRAEKPEFVMTAGTYESNIKTLSDNNNRPVYYETFNPIDGTETSTFKGKEVVFVNDGNGISDYDTAADGAVFALYWVPSKAYAINSNMQFSLTQWRDHANLQDITYALVVNDGKVLDPGYLYILKKKA